MKILIRELDRLDKIFIWSVIVIFVFVIGYKIHDLEAQEGLQELISLPAFRMSFSPKIYRFTDRGTTCYVGYGDSGRLSLSCVK